MDKISFKNQLFKIQLYIIINKLITKKKKKKKKKKVIKRLYTLTN